MMFGGSPISVAVPPMFEAITIGSSNTSGRIFIRRAMPSAIGVTKITVVTLSRNADAMAVNQAMSVMTTSGCPRARRIRPATAHSKTPVVLSTPTTAIIDASSTSTLMSSASIVPSNDSRWNGVKYVTTHSTATAPRTMTTRCAASSDSSTNTLTRITATMPCDTGSVVEAMPVSAARATPGRASESTAAVRSPRRTAGRAARGYPGEPRVGREEGSGRCGWARIRGVERSVGSVRSWRANLE